MFFTVTPELYDETSARLFELIGDENYFSGSLNFVFEGVSCRLRTSVIVYRRTERLPEGTFSVIVDLVPVWWEFHTESDEAGEMLNDFSFSELRAVLADASMR
ncbi:MAG: hypothetical protein K2G58_05120 [Alistipes sp.]|nr:hypothetical protein [Alistipes sp.]